jgi:hypothetical protein
MKLFYQNSFIPYAKHAINWPDDTFAQIRTNGPPQQSHDRSKSGYRRHIALYPQK